LVFWRKLILACQTCNPPYGCSDADHVYVEGSSDGGTTWSTLVDLTCTSNTTTWSLRQLSLSTYVGKKIKLRYRLRDTSNAAQADGWYIDDVVIQEAN
jgi:hypothetical protein